MLAVDPQGTKPDNSLVVLTTRNLTPQMPLLVVQILQLQVQRVDFLPRLAGFLLGAAHAQDGFTVQAAEVREVGVESLLLERELELLGCWVCVVGGVVGVEEVKDGEGLGAGEGGGVEDGLEGGFGDEGC